MAIDKARNPWLDHDNHVECNVLEWDAYVMDEAVMAALDRVFVGF